MTGASKDAGKGKIPPERLSGSPRQRVPVARWLLLVGVGALLLFRGPRVVAAVLTNQASRALLGLWAPVAAGPTVPRCQTPDSLGARVPLLRRMETAIGLAPSSLSARSALARLSWLQGECDEALELWRGMDPRELGAVLGLLWLGHADESPQESRDGVAWDAMRRGDSAAEVPDWSAALEWYRLAWEVWPQPEVAEKLAAAYKKLGAAESAIVIWRQVIENRSDRDSGYWWAHGRLAELQSQWGEAGASFAEAARLADDSFDLWMAAGLAWRKQGSWEEAIASFGHASDENPASIFPDLGLGHVWRDQGNYSRAIGHYERARSLEPKSSYPYYELGLTYYQAGDLAMAESHLRLSLERNAGHVGSAYTLALLLSERGDWSQAEAYLGDAIKLDSTAAPTWWVLLGDWLAARGECDGAMAAYRQAEALGAQNAIVDAKLVALTNVCLRRER